ncbi:MAG TPA: hypothetical protein P5140_08025 [Methanofastidiosum sp.]|nr:hypothetical protein [Methanofastidiosum sp.]
MGRLLHFGDRYMVLRQKAVIGVKGVSKISEVSFLPVLPNTVKLTKVILPVGWQDAL